MMLFFCYYLQEVSLSTYLLRTILVKFLSGVDLRWPVPLSLHLHFFSSPQRTLASELVSTTGDDNDNCDDDNYDDEYYYDDDNDNDDDNCDDDDDDD